MKACYDTALLLSASHITLFFFGEIEDLHYMLLFCIWLHKYYQQYNVLPDCSVYTESYPMH